MTPEQTLALRKLSLCHVPADHPISLRLIEAQRIYDWLTTGEDEDWVEEIRA